MKADTFILACLRSAMLRADGRLTPPPVKPGVTILARSVEEVAQLTAVADVAGIALEIVLPETQLPLWENTYGQTGFRMRR